MIKILQWVEDISSSRDRDRVAAIVVRAIFDLLQANSAMMFRVVHTAEGPRVLPVVRCTAKGLDSVSRHDDSGFHVGNARDIHDEGAPLHNYPLLERAFTSGLLGIEPRKRGVALIWPVRNASSNSVMAIVVAETMNLPDAEKAEEASRFLNFFGNYVGLLDYSELDSLTGLNNRKTYEETFERLLASIPVAGRNPEAGPERRHDEADQSYWLGEIDIDHFKRINDTFGHLFGDEVLLRVANLMRHSFRASDTLYRFGGEEFVVMLRSSTRESAARIFDRFRAMVEQQDFPQVGRVTCSVGYTRVDPLLLPADILGQADAALYYSKENGRNRTSCYDELVATGLLVPKSVEAQQIGADMDALFG